jgi:hypothetical protein
MQEGAGRVRSATRTKRKRQRGQCEVRVDRSRVKRNAAEHNLEEYVSRNKTGYWEVRKGAREWYCHSACEHILRDAYLGY